MGSLLKVQAARVLNVDASTYVGPLGLLWYDENSTILRIGDGVTPGGIPINFGNSVTNNTNFVPSGDAVYSLGTGTSRWSTLYLSSGTFYVGGNTITVSTGTITVNGIPIGSGFTGSRGSVGFIGSKGDKGDPGGYTGSAGYTGSGGQGYTGSGGPGFTGSQGAGFTGSFGYTGSRGYSGSLGYTGSGFTGSAGFVGSIGFSGSIGFIGSTGYVGSPGVKGDLGYIGSQGIIGFTGSSAGNNLIFTNTGTKSILTGYVAPNGSTYGVRTTEITSTGSLVLNLAAFTPILTSLPLPSSNLNWDQACTGFNVTVGNPIDFPSDWISSVRTATQQSGSVTFLASEYTTTGPTVTPAGGVTWQQILSTNTTATIRPISSTVTGGVASAVIKFNKKSISNPTEIEYLDGSANWTVNWATPTLSIAMTDPSGSTFLQTYTQTPYTVTVTGFTNPSNYALTVSSPIGSVSNVIGSGTLTFSTPIHKDNAGSARSISVIAILNRPANVTGTAYSVQLNATDPALSPTFSYPSFYLFTSAVNLPPQRGDIIAGVGFKLGVTVLGSQVKVFAGTVTNSQAVPRVFWFSVRTSASQPTQFKTGASASLLSDVAITTSTVQLSPDTPPAGYVGENYNLYGIILQPGNTYVSIG